MNDFNPFDDFVMWCAYNRAPADIDGLKKYAKDWRTMATQKTGGQPKYAKSGDINIEENLERIKMMLLASAVSVARDPRFYEICTPDSDAALLKTSVDMWWLARLKEAHRGEHLKMAILANAIAFVESGELEAWADGQARNNQC